VHQRSRWQPRQDLEEEDPHVRVHEAAVRAVDEDDVAGLDALEDAEEPLR
jgi:hypothetical protein